MPTTYALRIIAPNTYQIAKFTDAFIVDATYTLTRKGHGYSCDCPAGFKNKLKACKHQRMMPYLMGAVNLPRFFDPDTGNWHGLMDVAPGMEMEHADGEAAIAPQVQKGVAEIDQTIPVDEDGLEAELIEDGDIEDDQSELELAPAEPDQAGRDATPAQGLVSPDQTQTERPLAPAPSAPASTQVTRRI